jgi:nitroreductase
VAIFTTVHVHWNQENNMDFEQVITTRYSCRKFRSDPVPRATIERILELSQQTASWCNTQPWQLIVISGAAIERFRGALLECAKAGREHQSDFPYPRRYEGVYRDRRKVCGIQLYQSVGIGKDDRAASAEQGLENFRLFGAPHVALITTEDDLGFYGGVDCGLYVNSFMLAARNFGVDTIAQAALATHADFIREYFQLPVPRKFICGIAFGYSEVAHPVNAYRTARAGLADVVQFIDAV